MAGPNRPTPPSAFDGYRRLERTRRVAAPEPVPVATAVVPPRRRRPVRSARIAGIVRLATFVALLAIIIGTSVGLASADTRGAAKRRPAAKAATHVASASSASSTHGVPTSLVRKSAKAASDAADDVAATAKESAPVAVAATSHATPRVAARPTSELPFTGEPSLDRILLAGSALVLLGMLVQIAGQPLPANRAHARTR